MLDRERVIRQESDRIGDVLAACDPGRGVPTCPAWTAADLLAHVVTVHRFWAAVIGERLDASGVAAYERSRPPLPDGLPALASARSRATEELLAALEGREASEPAWSWFPPDQTVGFTWRMQTHEAAMHRVDAELAAGLVPGIIGTELAEDGVDHALDAMWAWAPPDAERRDTGCLELVATDSGRRWRVRTFRWTGTAWDQPFVDQIGCERFDDGEPDATVSGPAEALDLLVWGRADQNVTRRGDQRVLAEFQAMLDEGMQ